MRQDNLVTFWRYACMVSTSIVDAILCVSEVLSRLCEAIQQAVPHIGCSMAYTAPHQHFI